MESYHFVIRDGYKQRRWPDLERLLSEGTSVHDLAPRILHGVDCWIVETLLLLNKYFGDQIRFTHGPTLLKGTLGVVEWEHFGSRIKPHIGACVVARADRPMVKGADFTIVQNPDCHQEGRRVFIPHWPQPGLIPAQPRRRGALPLRAAYLGRGGEFFSAFFTPEILAACQAQGIALESREFEWNDYTNIDVALAIRHQSDAQLACKPASKLVNAWMAGAPMICQEEPSFKQLKRGELDYIRADTPQEFVAALARLRDDPDLYQAMVANGLQRCQEFEERKIADIWLASLRQIAAWSAGRSWLSRSGLGSLGRMLRYNSGHLIRRIASGNQEK